MTSRWQQLGIDIDHMVRTVLEEVPLHPDVPSQAGRPYLTVYQIAIRLDARFPEVRRALGSDVEVGGRDIGVHHSLASRLGQYLVASVKSPDNHDIEGAVISPAHVAAFEFTGSDRNRIRSSLPEAGLPHWIFRLRRGL
ncbi:hypothetical protein L6E12_07095 [Actinokineospora sp. PR83]|uniref:hypothetical protein n=1 Tax=Actinokineospora sp. PR83 TaxID=2884908 RepID=UPI001F2054E2|nr:hypothetical protein [Actinokineospora sp. PR83]MCG8915548.1 hypothetical protein [Actinokineospora sp. PR83]